MSDIIIRGEGLGKRYRRGVGGAQETLKDTLTRVIRSPLAAMRRPTQEPFWALRNVDLEVRQGQVLGSLGARPLPALLSQASAWRVAPTVARRSSPHGSANTIG